MIDFWDAAKRSETGPYIKEEDFDRKITQVAGKIVKKHGIKYDPENVIPTDDDLADRVYQAGLELFLELGIFCKDTGRLIRFSRSEVEWALNMPQQRLLMARVLTFAQ